MKKLRAERKHDAQLDGGRFCNVMAIGAAAVVGGSMYSANRQSKAAGQAAQASERGTELSVAETRRQFDAMQGLMKPYVEAGTGALTGQQNLLGLNGAEAQAQAISGIQNGSQYGAMVQEGENAMLQNASATGGLRGGNLQAAMAQFRPQILSQLIQQQYSNLGGITSMGQNAAAGVGNAGMQTGANLSNLFMANATNQGNAALARGQAQAGIGTAISQVGSLMMGTGGKF